MTIAWSITCAVLVPVACLGLVLWLEHLEDSLAEALQGLAAGDVRGSLSMTGQPEPEGPAEPQHGEDDTAVPPPDVEHSGLDQPPAEDAPVTTSPPEAVLQCDDSWNLAASAN